MRKKVIAGNWKMNQTRAEIATFMDTLTTFNLATEKVEAIICAPAVYLQTLVERAKGTPIKISAQTMHEADNGAFTGEISPTMLTDIGVSHVVIGHSERREYYGETNESVNKKTKAALTHGLVPIVCVGESLEQREANETMAVVEEQVTAALKDIAEADVKKVIIAYEPIWAIGTGKTATSEQ